MKDLHHQFIDQGGACFLSGANKGNCVDDTLHVSPDYVEICRRFQWGSNPVTLDSDLSAFIVCA